MSRVRLMAALVMAVAVVRPAAAQEAAPASDGGVRFLPRYVFHLSGEHLAIDDPRLVWEANYGGEIDFVDFGAGRVTFRANYQVLLGEEIRIFDPNQGNYLLEAAASGRVGGAEIAGVFHHISRHLADRPKQDPIDWNMAGVRLLAGGESQGNTLDTQVALMGVVQKSWVDYSWELDAHAGLRRPLRPRVVALARADMQVLGTDGTAGRGTQAGFRVEGGLSLEGEAGALELFAAVERRVDPVPFEPGALTWAVLGFRLVGR